MKSQLIHIDFTQSGESMFTAFTAQSIDTVDFQLTTDIEMARAVLYTYQRQYGNWPEFQMIFTWNDDWLHRHSHAVKKRELAAGDHWSLDCLRAYEKRLPGTNIRIVHESEHTRCWFSKADVSVELVKDLEWIPQLRKV